MSQYDVIPHIIAHRCNSESELLKVLNSARKRSRLTIECDVRTSKDGVLVVHHDAMHQGRIIGETNFRHFGGELLSLERWIDMVRDYPVSIHLDVKAKTVSDKWIAVVDSRPLYALLLEKDMLDRVIITAVAGKFLRELRELGPKLNLGVLYDEDYGTLMPPNKQAVNAFVNKILKFHNRIVIDGIFLNEQWLRVFDKKYKILDTFFYTMNKAGIRIAVWTVNDPGWAKQLVERGANWITTDGQVIPADLRSGSARH